MLQLLFLVCLLSYKVSVMGENVSQGNHPVSAARLNHLTGQLKAILQIDTTNKDKDSLEDSWNLLPPKYMIDLYHKYADDKYILDTDPELTTTIRCILGKVRRDSVHFNLSSLWDTKSISHAEVHVFRRTSRRGKAPRTKFSFAHHRIRLRNLPKKFLSAIISLLPSRGWQAVDITNTVKTSIRKAKVLSMTVEASIPEFGTGRAKYHTVPVDEVLRVAYRPFLVIFSTSPPPASAGTWSLPTTPGPILPGWVGNSLDNDENDDEDDDDEDEDDDEDDNSITAPTRTTTSTSTRSTATRQEQSSTMPPMFGHYPPFRNYAENFDELENSLKSILNIDKVSPASEKNNQIDKDFAIENNEIGESNSMVDHFHFLNSLPPSSQLKLPSNNLINHSSHSMGRRSIDDNEFSEDPLTSSFPPHPRHHTSRKGQRDGSENSLNDADDPQFGSNTLEPRHENEFSLRQDNLDNELRVSSPSASSSSKETNLNPILPYPSSRRRWWNQPSDRSWTPSFKKTRSRRKGKMNRRKLRRNRQEKKKYWANERPLPPSSMLPPLATMKTPRVSQLFNKMEDNKERGLSTEKPTCRVNELSVDIANLDWAGRIIAPAVLPLNHCEGTCSTHLTNNQDLTDSSPEDVKTLDFDYASASSATRCCLPYLKKRLVVLFADVHDNILLRIHPNSTIQSCQC